MPPETRYARSGEVHIAYQVVGEGPIDLLWVPTWIWQVEHMWEDPYTTRLLETIPPLSPPIMFVRPRPGLFCPAAGRRGADAGGADGRSRRRDGCGRLEGGGRRGDAGRGGDGLAVRRHPS